MSKPISFGDNVRVLRTPDTDGIGIAGWLGTVYGETTPSITNVDVVGKVTRDYALNVHFDDLDKSLWLVPELLEFVDHSTGTEVWIKGSPTKSVRQPDGTWLEVPVNPPPPGWFRRLVRRVVRGRAWRP